ncbi:hypothetical protein HELRODRAFT_104891 [Helobdella robusta]|uniref:Phosphoglucomutase-2 n=1 Tax=Helobdella robusta TaxID=6412 RepID=T1EDP1_HELRO|nr:hypothetical protein HELRODRAFT_104891 [Helobdella robusta]ESO10316.1 hypothetical protein HELRODRAFT_104891 [Helobdella robusta]
MQSPDEVLNEKVAEWLAWDKTKETKEEIECLKARKDYDELSKRLINRMKFGTAGLRAPMGAGYSRMNDLTVIQTTQGFCKYMLCTSPDVLERGVLIGYDGRHHSKRFAELAAAVLVSQEIMVYLFSEMVPTPLVAYGTLLKNCEWGIMVTASHNPKEDNGYKVVYASNGAQIMSPTDSEIEKKILQNLQPWPQSWKTCNLRDHHLVKDPLKEVKTLYMKALGCLCTNRELNKQTNLRFTYTGMHGVGFKFFKEAFISVFEFKELVPVKEQVEPNPDFPTVKFPNPEEGRNVLQLAINTAIASCSSVVIANDPDADRMAAAEKYGSDGWYIFSGNEIGALLGWWMVKLYKDKGRTAQNAWCASSAVSSRILKSICAKEGINHKETLTGFKYMGSFASEIVRAKKSFIFAFEEAIGFMCGPTVFDKDGISAGCVLADMAVSLNKQGLTMRQQLNNIYEIYGYHFSINSYYVIKDACVIKKIFDRIRHLGEKDGCIYPTKVGCYSIKYVRDLHVGYDSEQPNKLPNLPVSASSEMMTFTFEQPPVVMTLRTSGTEPKIKYYSEYIAPAGCRVDQSAVKSELENLLSVTLQEFLQPEVNGLIVKDYD